jgi:hypothetical protein
LRDKEIELGNLRSAMSVRADASALNVADYDVTPAVDTDRVHYLTETLVQKQGKIDSLLADNNMLRIQLEKVEVSVPFLKVKYARERKISWRKLKPVFYF